MCEYVCICGSMYACMDLFTVMYVRKLYVNL